MIIVFENVLLKSNSRITCIAYERDFNANREWLETHSYLCLMYLTHLIVLSSLRMIRIREIMLQYCCSIFHFILHSKKKNIHFALLDSIEMVTFSIVLPYYYILILLF